MLCYNLIPFNNYSYLIYLGRLKSSSKCNCFVLERPVVLSYFTSFSSTSSLLDNSGTQHLSSPRPFQYFGQYGGLISLKQKDPLMLTGVCCPIFTYSPVLAMVLGPEGHLLEQDSAIILVPSSSMLCAIKHTDHM